MAIACFISYSSCSWKRQTTMSGESSAFCPRRQTVSAVSRGLLLMLFMQQGRGGNCEGIVSREGLSRGHAANGSRRRKNRCTRWNAEGADRVLDRRGAERDGVVLAARGLRAPQGKLELLHKVEHFLSLSIPSGSIYTSVLPQPRPPPTAVRFVWRLRGERGDVRPPLGEMGEERSTPSAARGAAASRRHAGSSRRLGRAFR